MASDMHFGKLSGVSHLKRLVRHVNEMEPDIILLPVILSMIIRCVHSKIWDIL